MVAMRTTPDEGRPSTKHRVISDPNDDGWRLPGHHLQALRDVMQGDEESRAGIRTRYLPTSEQGGGPSGDDADVQLNDLERFVEMTGGFTSSPWRKGVVRCREAIERMRGSGQAQHAAVLAVVYGHACPSTRCWPQKASQYLGELAGLARYTDVVEVHRQAMVRAAARGARVASEGLSDLSLVIDMSDRRMRLAEADRIVSSGDALAELLDLRPGRAPERCEGEVEAAWEARRAPWLGEREAAQERSRSFLVEARAQASAMLASASRCYWEAWLAVGPRR